MNPIDSEPRAVRFQLSAEAEKALLAYNVVRDLDRLGHPHLLLKVPDLEKSAEAELGVEVARDDAGRVTVSVLLYDIPTDPVSYDLRFYPQDRDDLRFLHSFLDTGQFRLHACVHRAGQWSVGPSQTFRLPTDVLLRLRHYSKEWPAREQSDPKEEPGRDAPAPPSPPPRSQDPRDTVIRKLKEQVQNLRDHLQERDKRIIQLEDELQEIRSRGRSYRLSSDRKPWWKPFS